MVGRPFQKGEDSRRHTPTPGTARTLRGQARAKRDFIVERLVELATDEDARVAFDAVKLLAAYSDGAPSEKNVPEELPEETPESEAKAAEVLQLLKPPEEETAH